MDTLICYKTKHGATERYMNWLKEELGADLKTFGEVRKSDFSNYDKIVISSGTYAGLMPLNRFLKRNWKRLNGKKVVVVAVGAAPADDKWSLWSYNRIPKKIRDDIKYFKIIGEAPESARPKGYKSPVKRENLKEIVKEIKGAK